MDAKRNWERLRVRLQRVRYVRSQPSCVRTVVMVKICLTTLFTMRFQYSETFHVAGEFLFCFD